MDEKVPLRFGVLGQETTGPGGFAMAVRTIPKIWEVASFIHEVSPETWFINFTNPSGIVTQAILSHTPLKKVVGICDAPSSIHKIISHLLSKKEDEVHIDYFGINHFGWIKGVYVDGKDVLPAILELIKEIPDFERVTRFPPELLAIIKLLPNPYLYYYYFKEEALNVFGYDAHLEIQPPSALLGMRLLTSAIPVAALVLSLISVYLYPLVEVREEELADETLPPAPRK
ncbi:family 4 glycosyl hydrolase, partial [Candidatus Hakubella thermalkaliphila]